MTLQELAALPVGTHVRLAWECYGLEHEHGVIEVAGALTSITWFEGDVSGSLIDTRSQKWAGFVGDMEVE
jgi:hypothetical protein